MNRIPAGYWTYERCKRASLKYPNRSRFRKHCSGGYKAARQNGWLEELYPNTKFDKNALEYWTYERCRDEAAKYGLRSDFQRYSYAAYQVAYKMGWIEDFMPDKRKVRRRFCHPIIASLNEHLENYHLPANEVAEKAGVSVNTIARWRHGVKPDLELLSYVLEAMGLELTIKSKTTGDENDRRDRICERRGEVDHKPSCEERHIEDREPADAS